MMAHCTFRANVASAGGCIHIDGGIVQATDIVLTDNTVRR